MPIGAAQLSQNDSNRIRTRATTRETRTGTLTRRITRRTRSRRRSRRTRKRSGKIGTTTRRITRRIATRTKRSRFGERQKKQCIYLKGNVIREDRGATFSAVIEHIIVRLGRVHFRQEESCLKTVANTVKVHYN